MQLTEMTLPEVRQQLDRAAEMGIKLTPSVYATLERFITDRTEDDDYRRLLMDRLMLLK